MVRLSPETGILMSIFLQRDLAKVLEILMSGLTTSTSKRKTPTNLRLAQTCGSCNTIFSLCLGRTNILFLRGIHV
ncbi:MAG: hypothetical protein ACI9K1_002387 [Arcticibacterium sp.]